MEYDAAIIGAGIGGLSSALKLSLAGKKVLLIEKQPVPGGLATNFIRKGFVFESSLHCVDGLSSDGEIRKFLEKYGIDKKLTLIELKQFARVIYPKHDFIADFQRDNLIAYLKHAFPKEAKNIERLFLGVDKFYKEFHSFTSLGLPLWLKFILVPLIYPHLLGSLRQTAEEFIAKYTEDTELKAIVGDIWRFMGLPPSRLSAFYFLIVFRCYYYHSTAYIKGGFSRLFQVIVEKIKECGGEVKFNTSVEKIITDSAGKVKSALTDKGEEIKTRVVISNANCFHTLTELLDSEILKKEYAQALSPLEKSISAFQVYLGLDIPAADLGMNCPIFSINNTYDHNVNFEYSLKGDYANCSLGIVDHSQIDPGLVPPGKGSLLIMTLDAYKNWQNLSPQDYKKKKVAVAQELIRSAEKYLPGLSGHIEVMEAATPLTISRFGSLPQGAIYGLAQTLQQSGIQRLDQKTKVKGLFLAGAWTRPGAGVDACFTSGLDAADLALRFLK